MAILPNLNQSVFLIGYNNVIFINFIFLHLYCNFVKRNIRFYSKTATLLIYFRKMLNNEINSKDYYNLYNFCILNNLNFN